MTGCRGPRPPPTPHSRRQKRITQHGRNHHVAAAASAVVGIVVLITKLRLNPIIALVLGAAYLGLTTGLGPSKTAETIATGFGDLIAEIGLLVGFGVLMGALLRDIGTIERLVSLLLRLFGPRRVPYALALSIVTFLQSIFLDVLLVISAPLARNVAGKIDRLGTPA